MPDYAETLLSISETFRPVRVRPSALGLWSPCGKLEQRVAGMLNARRSLMVRMHRVTTAAMAAAFLTTIVVAAGTRLVQAQPPHASVGGPPTVAADTGGAEGNGDEIARTDR